MYHTFSKLATLSGLLCIEEIFFRFCLVAFEVVLSSKVHWFEMKELANQNSSPSLNPYFQLSFEEIVSFAPIFGKCKKPLTGLIWRRMMIGVIGSVYLLLALLVSDSGIFASKMNVSLGVNRDENEGQCHQFFPFIYNSTFHSSFSS